MPGTISLPLPDEPFGFAYEMHAETDLVGPFPSSYSWRVELWTKPVPVWWQADGVLVEWDAFPYTSNVLDRQFGSGMDHHINPLLSSVGTQLSPTTLIFKFMDDQNNVLDQFQQDQKLDLTTGRIIDAHSRSFDQGGGLTEEQALTLQETHDATIAEMGVPGSGLAVPVANLLTHPPKSLGDFPIYQTGLFGQGAFQMPVLAAAAVYGFAWYFTARPPALGVVLGLSAHYLTRMVQWRVIHTVGGVDVVTELIDADYEGVLHIFSNLLPTRIEYDILPGVTLDVRVWGLGNLTPP